MWPIITGTITTIFFIIAIPLLIKRRLEDRKIADINLLIEREKENAEN